MKEIPEMLLNKAMINPGFGGLAYFLESFKGAFGVAPTASVVTMTLACTLVDNNFIELLVLLYGVSVVSDVLLKDRDVILAENVIKGVDIAKRLRKKELLSKQFTFSSSSCSLTNNDDDDVCDEEKEDAALPVFTLKRPFENKDEIRRLNLFEPRWLAMLDEIANRNDGSSSAPSSVSSSHKIAFTRPQISIKSSKKESRASYLIRSSNARKSSPPMNRRDRSPALVKLKSS